MYETVRLLNERELADDDARFAEIFSALKLLPITLEKHEIAKNRRLSEPLQLLRSPARDDAGPKPPSRWRANDGLRACISDH
jgi:hypothetical protein